MLLFLIVTDFTVPIIVGAFLIVLVVINIVTVFVIMIILLIIVIVIAVIIYINIINIIVIAIVILITIIVTVISVLTVAHNATLNGLITNPPLMHSVRLPISFQEHFPQNIPLISTLTSSHPTNKSPRQGVLSFRILIYFYPFPNADHQAEIVHCVDRAAICD